MGVSLGEGMLMNGLLKSVARQPDIISELRSLMILGLPLLKVLSSLLLSFIYHQIKKKYKLKREDFRWKKVLIQPSILVLLPLI